MSFLPTFDNLSFKANQLTKRNYFSIYSLQYKQNNLIQDLLKMTSNNNKDYF